MAQAKSTFASQCFSSVDSTASFWKAYWKLTGSARQPLPPLKLPSGGFATSDTEKVTCLADEFDRNFNSEAHCAPTVPPGEPLDAEHLCHFDFIVDELLSLKEKSTGCDGIPAKFIKHCIADLAQPFHCLLNRCFLEGIFPSCWKHALIKPLVKVHGSNLLSDFRPVSILPIISKVAEKWLLNCLQFYFTPSERQFGFCARRSTEDAVGYVQFLVANALESCKKTKKSVKSTKVAVLSIDIKRAFDSVCPRKLISLLEDLHIPVSLLRILSSYLTGRSQEVKVGQATSGQRPCPSGVPQGSILGPFLFNVYIDAVLHLPLSSGATLVAYADDLLYIKPIPDSDAEKEHQTDLDVVATFYDSVMLTPNPRKSNMLICSISPQPQSIVQIPTLAGDPVVVVSELKYLGIVFDRKMDMSLQAKAVSTSSRKVLGALRRICKPFLSTRTFRQLYLSKVFPMLTYCIGVAAPIHRGAFCSLEKVHRLAARLVTNLWETPYFQLLQKLRWKSVSQTCFERRSKLAYKYVHGLRHVPSGVIEHQQLVERVRRTCYQPHELDLKVPSSLQKTIDSIPFLNLLHTWNALPGPVKSAENAIFAGAVRNMSNFYLTQEMIPDRLLLMYNL